MSISIVLGLAFVCLAIGAVVLQAWLWGPRYWDPVVKKSLAPRRWVLVHRAVGWAFVALYVGFLAEMVPRLWQYQVELPARTVVHITAAVVIGVVLAVKVAVLRFFRHFEEAMPTLGVILLVATVVLAVFSILPALRAHGTSAVFATENRERVERILGRLDLGEAWSAQELSTGASLTRGREVVVHRCSSCHDLRTVIAEPRTGAGWLSVTRRMQDKPTLAEPLSDDEVLLATAYLVAITPVLRDDLQRRASESDDRAEAAAALVEPGSPGVTIADSQVLVVEPQTSGDVAGDAAVPLDGGIPDAGVAVDAGRRPRRPRARDGGGDPAGETANVVGAPPAEAVDASLGSAGATLSTRPGPVAPPRYSAALAREILDRRCTDCHGLEDVERYGGADRSGWSGLLQRMVRRGAELDAAEARMLVQYLAATYPPVSS